MIRVNDTGVIQLGRVNVLFTRLFETSYIFNDTGVIQVTF